LSSTPYELPLGIKLWPRELRRHRNHLRQGYTFSLLENTADSYRFTIAASPQKVPDILRAFCDSSVDEAFLILEFYRNEQPVQKGEPGMPDVFYSPYMPVDELFAAIEPYLPRLIHDGFVGFGLANNRSGTEVFYSEEKVLTCFTDNHIRAMHQLHHLGIPHDENLLFHTDLGHDHLSLLCHARHNLPEPFTAMSTNELEFVKFCGDLVDELGMYMVEETLSFFLSRKEQDQIETCLEKDPNYSDIAAEDFGAILLDWNDFVAECEAGFEGDLDDYRIGLNLRDIIDRVVSGTEPELGRKILEIITEPDEKFRHTLTDCRKRLDMPLEATPNGTTPFWYQGIVSKQGASLRRDLIRQGWFRPHV